MLSDANYNVRNNETKGTGLKILAPKQMFQRLAIALAQVIIQKFYQMKSGKLFILYIK